MQMKSDKNRRARFIVATPDLSGERGYTTMSDINYESALSAPAGGMLKWR
jgi:hypothetical protein